MNNWRSYYQERLTTASQAVRLVKSGDLIVFSHACGEPRRLPGELVKRAAELVDVKIFHMVPMGAAPYCLPEYATSFRHISLFAGAPTRKALSESRADYVPCFFNRVPSLLGAQFPVDVAMVTVSPPDDNGYCSLGVSVDFTLKAVNEARLVICEVNPFMPRTHGHSFVHVEEMDCFVEVEEPIYELNIGEMSEVESKIGQNIAGLIDDGACLQLGIGGIPDAVLFYLEGFKDLGIHSEMISNGVMDLVEKGVITCRRKNLHQGRIVVTFMMGSRAFYDWVDDNPFIEMHPVDYVNNPCVIAQNHNMISINSALEVDLLGQVCADTLGPNQYSGVGGQVDFVRGAQMSEGGKAIIALPSTAKGGAVSRIVPRLTDYSAVTTSRNDVDFVVSEYGVAALKGKTVRQRIQALISIAHPDCREELDRQAAENIYKPNTKQQ
ncbi:MAG: 4-hydroxybutyrate CoA-transferase [Chloroflexi bacterium RBG_16_54_18]|nr:MAG: 4-hydroxybutyrate CoA-transferase [Chloroflexi bacterium RBG_16_54_18]